MSAVLPTQYRSLHRRLAALACGVSVAVLTGISALTAFGSTAAFAPAAAQTLPDANPDAQLLLAADELVYDNNAKIVTARGNVQLDYDGYNVVAQRVAYNQTTRRVKAFGNVEIIEPDGNRIYAQEIDLTDDFSDGFVNALRVETADNTRFAAESAERRAGSQTIFNNGVYTACEPCRENPRKPVIWQIKAEKVILDGVEKTVTYRNAKFELFGQPIAYLPFFKHADPSIKRKRGFLLPEAGYTDELGWWYKQSYFIPTTGSTDLTLTGAYFNNQGFLAQARWRQQFENGSYEIIAAGIDQQEPERFEFRADSERDTRAMVGTRGNFDINPRWSFGWNWLEQSDNNFSRTYDIDTWSDRSYTNDVHLKGLSGRNSLNLSVQKFIIQSATIIDTTENSEFFDQDKQAFVRPLLDYHREVADEVVPGLVTLDVNVQSIDRNLESIIDPTDDIAVEGERVAGLRGQSSRVSADLGWKQTSTVGAGLLLTPELSIRADAINTDVSQPSGFESVADGSETRVMPTAGLTASYPILVRTGTSSHVFEPVAQIYARPDLENRSVFANEDAQSLVFDTTTLFQRDKFSGYDRIEGGTRANIGLRYAGSFANGWTLNAVVGQSYQVAGRNPFARTDDLTNAGEDSGLERDVSDFVASLDLATGTGVDFNGQARFDNTSFELERTTLGVDYTNATVALSVDYTFIAAQPEYGFAVDREQIGGTAGWNFAENWSLTGGTQYSVSDDYFVTHAVGLSYSDECFLFALNFNRTNNEAGDADRSLTFRVALRTVGDFDYTADESQISAFEESGTMFGDGGREN